MKKDFFSLAVMVFALALIGCAQKYYYVRAEGDLIEEEEVAIESGEVKEDFYRMLIANEDPFTLKIKNPETGKIFILPPGEKVVIKVKEKKYIFEAYHVVEGTKYTEINIMINGVRNDKPYQGKIYDAAWTINKKEQKNFR